MGVLDGWELTRAHVDAHPPSRVGDCTHYCIVEGGVVGGVYGALNNAMALWLQSSACRGRADGIAESPARPAVIDLEVGHGSYSRLLYLLW